jgi:hypothetical protein
VKAIEEATREESHEERIESVVEAHAHDYYLPTTNLTKRDLLDPLSEVLIGHHLGRDRVEAGPTLPSFGALGDFNIAWLESF